MEIFSLLKSDVSLTIHPQEDYFAVSKKYPIFVVADGVSLKFDNESDYPAKSGAGDVAKIFCEIIIAEAEKRFNTFEEKDIREIFKIGNKAILEFNISQGRTKNTINYWDCDLFSATTSFVLIKNNKVYWWSLCDCGVVILKNNKIFFQSPNGWVGIPSDWNEGKNDKEKIITRHKKYRNAAGIGEGELIGYGVVDGEDSVILYLNTGVVDINENDKVALYSDGFENYFSLNKFINTIILWPEDIKSQLENIIIDKSKENNDKFGREKTLVIISI